jgi:hypothetical protein
LLNPHFLSNSQKTLFLDTSNFVTLCFVKIWW